MPDSAKKTDDQKFNETLKRMLKTPPKPHEKTAKDKAEVTHLKKSADPKSSKRD